MKPLYETASRRVSGAGLLLAWLVLMIMGGPVGAAGDRPSDPVTGGVPRIKVFVSVLPQKYFVERVGGDAVEVDVLVGPGRNPATYEPTPRQMVSLGEAQLYFRIGVPFEVVWMDRIRAAHPRLQTVDCRDGIAVGERDFDQPTRRTNAHAARHPDGPDPHIWTDPALVKIVAGTIRDALIAAAPRHREQFEANYREFAADLDELDGEIRRILSDAGQRRFMVFHPAWGYFALAYGLEQIAIEHEGKTPAARSLTTLIEQARQEGIKVIFTQAQFSAQSAETLARAIGGRVVSLDPLAEPYLDNMRRVASAFAETLQ
ncbi:MAG: zinc ABC transporter substrate-binding protein [Pseudomonadota bacterium]